MSANSGEHSVDLLNGPEPHQHRQECLSFGKVQCLTLRADLAQRDRVAALLRALD